MIWTQRPLTCSIRTLVVATICAIGSVATSAQRPESGTLVTKTPIYLLPDATRAPLVIGEPGMTVRILETTGDWYRIEFRDSQFGNRVGYVLVANVRRSGRDDESIPSPGVGIGPVGPRQRAATPTLRQAAI